MTDIVERLPGDWYERWQDECTKDHGEYPDDQGVEKRLRWWRPKSAKHGSLTLEDDLIVGADEIERLRQCLRWQDDRDGVQSTHSDECYSFGHRHYECALREIKRLGAERDALIASTASVQSDQRAAIDQARELLRIVTAERDALRELLCECRIALMWPGGPAQAFLDRIDAATASQTTDKQAVAPA